MCEIPSGTNGQWEALHVQDPMQEAASQSPIPGGERAEEERRRRLAGVRGNGLDWTRAIKLYTMCLLMQFEPFVKTYDVHYEYTLIKWLGDIAGFLGLYLGISFSSIGPAAEKYLFKKIANHKEADTNAPESVALSSATA